MAKKGFLVSDESINSHGFRVLTKGIQLKNFKKNPVGFFNHNTGGSCWSPDPNYTGPVIRWEDIEADGDKLYANPIFDENDPTGKMLADKVANDFIRAASIGFRIIETSNDPALMEKGQQYPTVTKCELLEISVVDIPANKNALALYDDEGKRIELNDDVVSVTLSARLPKETKEQLSNQTNTAMSKLTDAIKNLFNAAKEADVELSDKSSTETIVEQPQEQLAEKDKQITTLQADNKKLTDELTTLKAAHAGELKAANDKYDALEAESKKLVAEVEKIEDEKEAATKRVTQLENHCKSLKSSVPIPAPDSPMSPGAEAQNGSEGKPTVEQIKAKLAAMEAEELAAKKSRSVATA